MHLETKLERKNLLLCKKVEETVWFEEKLPVYFDISYPVSKKENTESKTKVLSIYDNVFLLVFVSLSCKMGGKWYQYTKNTIYRI